MQSHMQETKKLIKTTNEIANTIYYEKKKIHIYTDKCHTSNIRSFITQRVNTRAAKCNAIIRLHFVLKRLSMMTSIFVFNVVMK